MKKIYKLLVALVQACLGWPIYGIARLIPRFESKIVLGVHTSSFSGNVKALFLDKSFEANSKKIFIYKSNAIKNELAKIDAHTLYYSRTSVLGIWHMLTAKWFIYSSYPSDISYWFSGGASYFNVWHGTPLKNIERDVKTGIYALKNKYDSIFKYLMPAFFVIPNKMLVSSNYEKECFKSAFLITESECIESFPPRLRKVVTQLSKERKKILYCPTWRDEAQFSFKDYVDLKRLNEVCAKKGYEFIVKAHPSDSSIHLDKDYSHIKLADKFDDIYDILPQVLLVVTDYSSMIFEAIYCDLAVIIFAPDYEHYKKVEREFYKKLEDLPAPLLFDGASLEKALSTMDLSKSVTSNSSEFSAFSDVSIQLTNTQ